nr:39S ribosomal protein L12, mitochondrial isoform X1 [Marmota flaviventris]
MPWLSPSGSWALLPCAYCGYSKIPEAGQLVKTIYFLRFWKLGGLSLIVGGDFGASLRRRASRGRGIRQVQKRRPTREEPLCLLPGGPTFNAIAEVELTTWVLVAAQELRPAVGGLCGESHAASLTSRKTPAVRHGILEIAGRFPWSPAGGGKVAVCACAAQRAALWVISGPLRLEWPGPARMPGGLWARAAAQLACSWLERRLRAEPRVTFPLPERCYRRPPAACGGRPSGFGPPRSVSPGDGVCSPRSPPFRVESLHKITGAPQRNPRWLGSHPPLAGPKDRGGLPPRCWRTCLHVCAPPSLPELTLFAWGD